MKVLLINGGPHKNGCTNVALEEIAKTLEEENIQTEIMWLGTKPIGGCIGCNYCLNNDNKCFMDDIVNEFLDKAKNCEGFIFGSPVHFAGASGALTSFLDRAFYGRSQMFESKVCASVVSCRRGGATAAFDQINKYALMNKMVVIGSSYWNQIHGTNQDEAKKDLEGLQTMRNLAKNMAYVLRCMDIAKKENINKPEFEKSFKTNFIR